MYITFVIRARRVAWWLVASDSQVAGSIPTGTAVE